ncbi:MAG: hypothetical protein ACTHKV_14960 [Flavipsychrobacter sp.]
MITIRIPNVGDIDLGDHTQLVREFETGIFDRELKSTDFTYPVEVPMSDNLKRILSGPDIVANPNLKRDFAAQLIVDGLYISDVTMRIIKTDIRAQTITISIIGSYGSFAQLVGTRKLTQMELDGVRVVGNTNTTPLFTHDFAKHGGTSGPVSGRITYYDCTTATHMKDVYYGTVAADYAFPMCMDLKKNLPWIHDDVEKSVIDVSGITSYTDIRDSRSILNAYYHTASAEGYRDPIQEYINSTFMGNVAGSAQLNILTKDRIFWVPMFYVHYVLRKCFEEAGFTVSGGAFSNPKFTEKILYNTYAINNCWIDKQLVNNGGGEYRCDITVKHQANTINPTNHVPDMLITDFLSDMGKLFNLQYIINFSTREVRIELLDSLVPTGNIVDLTDKAFPEPVLNFEDDNFNKGFEFSFGQDSNNDASGEDQKDDIDNYHLMGNVRNYGDLAAVTGMATGDLMYVKAENAYYQYGGSDWLFYSHNLGKYKTTANDDVVSIVSKSYPLPMQTFDGMGLMYDPPTPYGAGISYYYTYTMPYSKMGISGVNLLGIVPPQRFDANGDFYFNYWQYLVVQVTNREIRNTTGIVLGYFGGQIMKRGDTDPYPLYPFASNTSYDANGDAAGNNCLSWHSPMEQGLHPDFWKSFTDTLLTAIQVDYQVLLDGPTYQAIDFDTNYFKIQSSLFLCKKATPTFPFPSIAVLTLIRI